MSPAAADPTPALSFAVDGAEAVPHAAGPTLGLRLRIESPGREDIRALALAVQVRIAVPRRSYDRETRARLVPLFGDPERWGTTARSLLWTQATVMVPPFRERAHVDLPIPCTYDLEVASARYLHALADGDIPLELLFSGTVFYAGVDARLQTGRIPWDREASFRLPLSTWTAIMAHHFPGHAWLRVPRETFDRLVTWRDRRGLASWADALEALLMSAERLEER